MSMLRFMGPSCELTLHYRPATKIPSTVVTLPCVVGDEEGGVDKLEEYLKGLEEERLKIEAFRRELPFSLQLLNDFIEASRCQQANFQSKKSQKQTVVKPSAAVEFIPENKTCGELSAKKSKVEDAPNWMRSAGLWSKSHESEQDACGQTDSHVEKAYPLGGSSKHLLDYKSRVGGAFHPFSKERQQISSCSDVGEQVSDSHSSSFNKCVILNNNSSDSSKEGVEERIPPNTNISNASGAGSYSNGKTQKKARRCWSQELHRKFVNALQQLGGAHATPKHIRDLMKVDGLTNDEVKSHLQKYRLHVSRPASNGPRSSDQSHGGELLVVSGIWVPPEYAGASTQLHTHTYYCQSSTSTGLQDCHTQTNFAASSSEIQRS